MVQKICGNIVLITDEPLEEIPDFEGYMNYFILDKAPKSPFEGIKTLADIKKEEIFLALRESREEN